MMSKNTIKSLFTIKQPKKTVLKRKIDTKTDVWVELNCFVKM